MARGPGPRRARQAVARIRILRGGVWVPAMPIATVLDPGGRPTRPHPCPPTGGRARVFCGALSIVSLAGPAMAWAQAPSQPAASDAQHVEVTGARVGRMAPSIGSDALPAAVQVLDSAQIGRLNVRSYADLFQTLPGVQSKHFGQGDIGAPFVMRGFGAGGSHGAGTAVFIDGVPQNIPSGGIGGNGTTEYNWLTPEMIERIEVIKGPFSALHGDQALAGVVHIVTRRCARSTLGLDAGSYGLLRVAGAGCHAPDGDGGITFFGAFEAFHSDGYRARSAYDRVSVLGKATWAVGASELSVRANAFRSVYDAPGYLNHDALRAGLLDPRASPFASDGGDNTRASVVATVQPALGEAGWYGTLYVDRFDRTRWGSFNAAMPLVQGESIDRRTVWGGRVHHHWAWGRRGALTLGLDTRHDRGDIASHAATARQRTGTVHSDYGLDIRSVGAFVQVQWVLGDDLKLVGGWRHDRFEQAIDNRRRPERSGSGSQSVGSPRVGGVWRVSPVLSVFANAGRGFRSLGAHELSPSGAVGASDFGLRIPEGRTFDLGFDARWNGLALSGNLYRTRIRSELRQEPPGSGILVNIGDSERMGHEIDARWRAGGGLVLRGSYARLDAQVRNPVVAAQTKLQNAAPHLVTLGIASTRALAGGRLLLDANLQHHAPETFYLGDVERRTEAYQVLNLRATLERGRSTYSVSATFEPRRFASDQAGTSFNPKPRQQFGLSYAHAL